MWHWQSDASHDYRRRKTLELNLLPLINVVLLLLIFFLVAGRIAPADMIPIDLPFANQGKETSFEDTSILISNDGRVVVDGIYIDEATLEALVSYQLEENPNKAIKVKADGSLAAPLLHHVLRQIQRAGGRNVALITQQE